MFAACATSPYDRGWISEDLAGAAAAIGPDVQRTPTLPAHVSLADGLGADEAVSVALWNSPSFQADLAQLSLARADLADAGALPNPMLTTLFPLGPHQLSGYLLMPLSALVQRPSRVKLARGEVERVARSLVQTGLETIRDARVAHAEAHAAAERTRAREEMAGVWRETEALARARAEFGDTSRLEFDAIHAEALLAADLAARARQDVELARVRVRLVLGLSESELPATVEIQPPETATSAATATLIREALAARPDLRAAELAVEVAGGRLGLERARIFQGLLRIDGQLDALGPRAAVGLHQVELPVFNWNPGGRARARAELQRALWRYAAVRQQIVADVTTAEIQLRQASASLARWRDELLQTLGRNVVAAKASFSAGNESYVVVLDATRRLQDAQLREIDLRLDLQRAAAQLDRAVGRRIAAKGAE